jgi:hypothetical protein
MHWQDPIVDRWISHDCLRAAFAEAFAIDPSNIAITDYPELWTGPIPPEPRLHLGRVRQEGPFPLQLSVAVVGAEIERPVADLAGTLMRARELAKRLGATMLFGTGPIGYEEQIRVAPDGTVDIVQLDGDELDEERYVIVGSRPFSGLPAEAAHSTA